MTAAADRVTEVNPAAGASTAASVDARAVLLASGMRRLGLRPPATAVIFMTALDSTDAEIGRRAALSLSLDIVMQCVPPECSEALSIAESLARRRPEVIIACPQGAAALREVGARALIIGDAPGVLWWTAIELRESRAADARRAVVTS